MRNAPKKITMQKSGNNWIVTPEEIEIEEGFNARYNYGDIEELCNSIISNGLKIPLKGVKNGEKFILTDGHRRYKSLQLAYSRGFTDIKITISPEAKQSQEERVLSMITYNSGKPFEMLEEADIYKRLSNWGWAVKQIAEKVGKSGQYIRDCLQLNTASMALKKQIQNNRISATTVLELMKKNTTQEVEIKVETAIAEKGGGRVSKKHIVPTKPTTKNIEEVLYEIKDVNEDLFNSLCSFIKYQNGEISKRKLFVEINIEELAEPQK